MAATLGALVLVLVPVLIWRERTAPEASATSAPPVPVSTELAAPIPRARFDSLHAEMLRLQALGDTASVRLLADSLLAAPRAGDPRGR